LCPDIDSKYGPDTWLSLYELYQFMAGIVDVRGSERVMFPGCESGIPVLACLDKEPGAMVYGQESISPIPGKKP